MSRASSHHVITKQRSVPGEVSRHRNKAFPLPEGCCHGPFYTWGPRDSGLRCRVAAAPVAGCLVNLWLRVPFMACLRKRALQGGKYCMAVWYRLGMAAISAPKLPIQNRRGGQEAREERSPAHAVAHSGIAYSVRQWLRLRLRFHHLSGRERRSPCIHQAAKPRAKPQPASAAAALPQAL